MQGFYSSGVAEFSTKKIEIPFPILTSDVKNIILSI